MENVIIDVKYQNENTKSLLINEAGESVRERVIFKLNKIMGANYLLLNNEQSIKFKLNTLQTKIVNIAFAMVNPKEKIDITKPPLSYTFTIDKLIEILGVDDNSHRLRYEDIPNFLRELMCGDNFSYIDNNNNMNIIHMFDWVQYDESKHQATFRFSWSMIANFLTITNKEGGEYQNVKLKNLLSFDTLYGMNLYEKLKTDLRGSKERYSDIDINDLRKILGADGKITRYFDFKKRILQRSVDEINSKQNIDIKVSYEERKKGRSVIAIIFHIENLAYNKRKVLIKKDDNIKPFTDEEPRNENAIDVDYEEANKDVPEQKGNEERKIKNAEKMEIISFMRGIIPTCLLTDASLYTIYKIANGNTELIKEVYNLSLNSNYDDLGKWMVGVIKKKNEQAKREVSPSGNRRENTDSFNNFEQRQYDFNDLEKRLLGWTREERYDDNEGEN